MNLTAFDKLLTTLALACLLLVASITYSFILSKKIDEQFELVQHSNQVVSLLDEISSNLYSSESQVRGYMITRRPEFLEDLDGTKEKILRDISALENLIQDNPSQVKRTKILKDKINYRLSLLDESVEATNTAATDEDLNSRAAAGRRLMVQLSSIREQMEKEERFLLNQRRKTTFNELKLSQGTIISGGIFTLAISAFSIIILFRDIRRRKKVEYELKSLNENKNKFFSVISHDLRGPVNAMVRLISFLNDQKRPPSPSDEREIKYQLERSSVRVSQLLDNLLKWSKLQMDKFEVFMVPIDLKHMVSNNIETFCTVAEQKEIIIENNIPDNTWALADKNMLDTILRNLISNAIKFTNQGGKVLIKAVSDKNQVFLSITDFGIGMSPEELDRIFRIDETYSKKGTANEQGTGLGLIICKDFVEKNEGTIHVESIQGKGSTFILSLRKP